MYRGHTVAVVVPAYNEEAYVGDVLATIPQFVDRIYAVDDRSTDMTWEIIQSIAAEELFVRDPVPEETTPRTERELPIGTPQASARASIADGGTLARQRIVPIRHEENQGAGAALRTGYLRALSDRMDIVVAMDADGQMDPDQLPRLLDPIAADEADYAKGNRLARRDHRTGMPSFRLFGNRLLTFLTKASSGYWGIDDPQNGYTAISHEALASIGVEDIPDDHNYTNDLLVRLNVSEMRVADVPMPAVYNDEESTIQYRTFVPRTSRTLASGFLYRLRRRYDWDRPRAVPLLYLVGLLALVPAVTGGLAMMASPIGEGASMIPAVLGVVLLAGALALGTAVALDVHENAELEVAA